MPSVGRGSRTAGGICERNGYFVGTDEMASGHYSLNSLVVSQLNAGQRLPAGVTSLTVTHELGHSFGAPHDDVYRRQRPRCLPGDRSRDGNYIMAATAPIQLDQANNWLFSTLAF